MIKVTYYVGTNDKDTLRPKLCKKDFIKVFDELFKDYTLVEAIGRFTDRNNQTTEELSLVITTFIDDCTETTLRQHTQHNCSILKDKLNQDSILVEITRPEVMFL